MRYQTTSMSPSITTVVAGGKGCCLPFLLEANLVKLQTMSLTGGRSHVALCCRTRLLPSPTPADCQRSLPRTHSDGVCSQTPEFLRRKRTKEGTVFLRVDNVRKGCSDILLGRQALSERWDGKSDTPAAPPLINPPTHRWRTSRQTDAKRFSLRRSAAPRRWTRGINSVPASLFSVKATCSVSPSWTA